MSADFEPVSIERRLDRLESIHEIRQLPYRYALAFDNRDREAFLSLWAPVDEPAVFPDMDGVTVAERIDHFFRHGSSVMFVGNHLIDFQDGNHATGVVYAWPQVAMDVGFVDQIVRYEDRYVRAGGSWRFAVRRHLLVYGQRRAEDPFGQPQADWPAGQVGRGVVS
jgi:hypothetical protein